MDDRKLVEEILEQGRTAYFSEIVKRYSGMVYSKALSVVHREELAAEVTQATFVKAYEQLAVWHGQRMGPWLMAIAMHTALHILEKERTRRGQPAEELSDRLADRYDNEHEEMIQRMEEAISQLTEGERQLIDLHYYQQKKTEEIARQMGISQSNVLVRLHRIREKLRERLKATVGNI